MSGNYALTDIKHGDSSTEGEFVYFKQGDEVTGLDDASMEALRQVGSVGDLPPDPQKIADDNEALKAQVAELEAKLEAALASGSGDGQAPPLQQPGS